MAQTTRKPTSVEIKQREKALKEYTTEKDRRLCNLDHGEISNARALTGRNLDCAVNQVGRTCLQRQMDGRNEMRKISGRKVDYNTFTFADYFYCKCGFMLCN